MQRFWDKVDKTDGCWLWTAARNTKGYGRFRVDGNLVSPHRFAYELEVGPIPNGLWVLHHCDNPRCVNPGHLFLGTHSDNMRDSFAKGRMDMQGRGVKAGRALARLPDDEAKTAIEEYRGGRKTQVGLAGEYGISVRAMGDIIRRTSYKHLDLQ